MSELPKMPRRPSPEEVVQETIDALGIEVRTTRHEHVGVTLHTFATCPSCGAMHRAYIAVFDRGAIGAACQSRKCNHGWGWPDLRALARSKK